MDVAPSRHTTTNGRIAILVAAVAWSLAGLGQRGLDATPATQVAGRALFAFLALLVVVAVTERSGIIGSFRSLGRDGLTLAVFLAISSGTFLLALNYTSVANVLFLQAASPMMAALLGWILLSERISRRTWIAMLLAAVGVGAMVLGSFDAGVLAVVLPIVMTASFAIVIVIARHRRDVSMMPATCASQVLVVVVVAPFASFTSATTRDWEIFFALGVFQMGFGLALLVAAGATMAASPAPSASPGPKARRSCRRSGPSTRRSRAGHGRAAREGRCRSRCTPARRFPSRVVGGQPA